VATLESTTIGASGDTVAEARSNLKAMIVATYRILSTMKPEQLGKEPANQLRFLQRAIVEPR
jgi:hypothetical protein